MGASAGVYVLPLSSSPPRLHLQLPLPPATASHRPRLSFPSGHRGRRKDGRVMMMLRRSGSVGQGWSITAAEEVVEDSDLPGQFPKRSQSDCSWIFPAPRIAHFDHARQHRWCISAASKKNSGADVEEMNDNGSATTAPKAARRVSRRTRKKVDAESMDDSSLETTSDDDEKGEGILEGSRGKTKTTTRKGRKKAITSSNIGEETTVKKTTRRRVKKNIDVKEENTNNDPANVEGPEAVNTPSEKRGLQTKADEDISYTYSWPPLVCCFGAAHNAFIPSGKPANRLVDHEIHEKMKDMFWSPDNFVRSPGGPASSVAIALAAIGGRVEFMGKLGDDEYGQNMLYFLNVNNVQTRSIKMDNSRPTTVSQMKIIKRGGLRMNCVKPSAEDSLQSSDINVDVLREAKMFYFNSLPLLDENMRSTTLQAIKICKEFGCAIFFDLNLPLPLWNSSEETMELIQEAWRFADMVEVTKQELEFLCGIKPSEKFDTKDNDKSKYMHHSSEVVAKLWHENLKVLFVTNGTSKIHYYTEKHNGCVHGMEDPPITPFTGDMSASGDAIVAALMRMLTVQPDLVTDKHYLEHMIKYAINCGVIDQWLLARTHGFPPKEGMGESEEGPIKAISEREYRTLQGALG